jgi:hypothetical protein
MLQFVTYNFHTRIWPTKGSLQLFSPYDPIRGQRSDFCAASCVHLGVRLIENCYMHFIGFSFSSLRQENGFKPNCKKFVVGVIYVA